MRNKSQYRISKIYFPFLREQIALICLEEFGTLEPLFKKPLRKYLWMLLKKANFTFGEIGRTFGVSRQAVAQGIKKLAYV